MSRRIAVTSLLVLLAVAASGATTLKLQSAIFSQRDSASLPEDDPAGLRLTPTHQ